MSASRGSGLGPRSLALFTSRSRRPTASTAAARASRCSGSVTSPATTTASGRCSARPPGCRASSTSRQPRRSRARARARPRPRDPPVTRATGCVVCVMRRYSDLKLTSGQASISGRACFSADDRPAHRRRGGRAQRRRRVGAALLRARRADRREADHGQPASLRPLRPPAAGVHPRRPHRGPEPGGGRRRAGHPPGRPHSHPGGLDPAVPHLAATPRRADRGPGAAPGRAGLLHRLRLPVAPAVRDVEPRGRDGRATGPARGSCRAGCARRTDAPDRARRFSGRGRRRPRPRAARRARRPGARPWSAAARCRSPRPRARARRRPPAPATPPAGRAA